MKETYIQKLVHSDHSTVFHGDQFDENVLKVSCLFSRKTSNERVQKRRKKKIKKQEWKIHRKKFEFCVILLFFVCVWMFNLWLTVYSPVLRYILTNEPIWNTVNKSTQNLSHLFFFVIFCIFYFVQIEES